MKPEGPEAVPPPGEWGELETRRSEVIGGATSPLSTPGDAGTSDLLGAILAAGAWTPDRIGRFRVTRRLGAGGMGVVYEAMDEQLGRRVAIKVVLARSGEAERSRLYREAQALARLSHPNVVTVYEAGFHGDAFFVAMELLEGQTLESWLRGEKRPWREVLGVFAQAGQGLAAAHGAGLVHRDFKPENAMIDASGRVKVLDFGLARHAGAAPDPAEQGAAGGALAAALALPGGDVEQALTVTGAILGTPAYMALEQIDGRPLDARSDQYSFCVALHEGLYGERPYRAQNLDDLRQVLARGEVAAADPRSDVPLWLRGVILRGLGPDPAGRWPSMSALLAALADDPAVRRRRRVRGAAAGLALLIGVAGGFAFVVGRPGERAVVCARPEDKLAGLWDGTAAARMRAAFAGTARPGARSSADRVAARLDAYTREWAAMHRAACEATASGEQSAELLDRRMACLDRRAAQMRAVVDVLGGRVDGVAVDRSLEMVGALDPLAACADPAELLGRVGPPADPARRARVQELELRLDRAEVERRAGHPQVAADSARAVIDAARPLDFAPTSGRAAYLLGRSLEDLGRPADAHDALIQALSLAERAGAGKQAADLLIELITVVGLGQERHDAARLLGKLADAALTRSDLRGDQLRRARLLGSLGDVASDEGNVDQALDLQKQALALRRRVLPADDPELAGNENGVGNALARKGLSDEARAHYGEALAISRRAYGENHPAIALEYMNLGVAARNPAEAKVQYLASLAILEHMQENKFYPEVLHNLSSTEMELGELDSARVHTEKALAVRKERLGPEHPEVAASLNMLGNIVALQGDLARALTLHRQALALREKTLGADHPRYALTLTSIGEDLRRLGRPAESLAPQQRAHAILVAKLGPKHPDLGYPIAFRGLALFDLGRRRQAIPVLKSAVNMLPPSDADWARAAFALARALEPRRPRSPRIRALARQALATFTAAHEKSEQKQVAAYLARGARR